MLLWAAVGTLFLLLVLCLSVGITSFSQLRLEVRVIIFKVLFALSSLRIEQGKKNYVKMWDSAVQRHGRSVFIEDKTHSYTFREVVFKSSLELILV